MKNCPGEGEARHVILDPGVTSWTKQGGWGNTNKPIVFHILLRVNSTIVYVIYLH